ncbi:AraC family transcriptional regulator [Hymenobacter sp. ASUV-10]|uniref:AraC family transcriptional regulator n=1 Tax=Hymenobacter aranciens TaxID=3063996 RepID=A0ABT9BAD7_9BACT|nr:AraC family transcriptional regulator [Hymenobacter sp. ASUV-10]
MIPTYGFDAYPQATGPVPHATTTEALEQLVTYRREEWFATCRQHMEQHRRHFYKLALIQEGGGRFFLNDEVVEVAPRSLLLVKPGTALGWHLHAGAQTGLYSFFSAAFYNAGLLPGYQLHAVLAGAAPYVYHACTAAEFAALHQAAEQLLAQQPQLEKARHALRLLLADVHQWTPAQPAAGLSPQVQQFLQLAESRLADAAPALTLEPYAKALFLTPKRLSELCRQATGKSATDLLKEKVATEAKVLLTATPLPISELGYRLGFYDVAHFSRWFKLAVGQTPSAYRAQFTGYK